MVNMCMWRSNNNTNNSKKHKWLETDLRPCTATACHSHMNSALGSDDGQTGLHHMTLTHTHTHTHTQTNKNLLFVARAQVSFFPFKYRNKLSLAYNSFVRYSLLPWKRFGCFVIAQRGRCLANRVKVATSYRMCLTTNQPNLSDSCHDSFYDDDSFSDDDDSIGANHS